MVRKNFERIGGPEYMGLDDGKRNGFHYCRLYRQTALLGTVLPLYLTLVRNTLDEATDPWGVKVERVEVKDVRLPVQLQRAMAAEAEAAREARAKVIAAEGEKKASHALNEAANVICESPSAIQLRYLQTLNSIR
ncbi:unnamed protein product [Dracunculus medinensis]|uniref:PHB domain-containing protein n=1 Tax=Dracunculus medinensis TaxID=318479 RepID=A0A0N4UEY4_DRAME|nr:unnamed protein product [Dracunculus medinensis]